MRNPPADLEVGEEVVDGLGEDARPIDGVDGTEMVFLVEGLVCEQRFHNVLRKENDHDDCPTSIARKLTWHESKVPFTAMLHTLESVTVVIWASCTGETRPLGCKMNIDTFFFPLKP